MCWEFNDHDLGSNNWEVAIQQQKENPAVTISEFGSSFDNMVVVCDGTCQEAEDSVD